MLAVSGLRQSPVVYSDDHLWFHGGSSIADLQYQRSRMCIVGVPAHVSIGLGFE